MLFQHAGNLTSGQESAPEESWGGVLVGLMDMKGMLHVFQVEDMNIWQNLDSEEAGELKCSPFTVVSESKEGWRKAMPRTVASSWKHQSSSLVLHPKTALTVAVSKDSKDFHDSMTHESAQSGFAVCLVF